MRIPRFQFKLFDEGQQAADVKTSNFKDVLKIVKILKKKFD